MTKFFSGAWDVRGHAVKVLKLGPGMRARFEVTVGGALVGEYPSAKAAKAAGVAVAAAARPAAPRFRVGGTGPARTWAAATAAAGEVFTRTGVVVSIEEEVPRW